jgi:hypothetical protein
MESYVRNAPWWVWSLLGGAVVAVCTATAFKLADWDWPSALATGAAAGAIFGAISGPITARSVKTAQDASGAEDLTREQMRSAGRAALRGPAPADPVARSVAARLATQQRDQTRSLRPWLVAPATVMLVLFLFLALTSPSEGWWWGMVVLAGALIGFGLVLPRHFRHRSAMLEDRALGDR